MRLLSRPFMKGLRRRILLVNGAFLVGTSLCLATVFFLQARTTVQDEFRKRGTTLAGIVAFRTWEAIAHSQPSLNLEPESPALPRDHDPMALFAEQMGSLPVEEEVRYVLVLDGDRKPIVFSAFPGVESGALMERLRADNPDYARSPEFRLGGRRGELVHGFGAPVCAEHRPPIDPGGLDPALHAGCRRLATVWLGMSAEPMLAAVNRAFWTSLLAGLACGAAALVAISFLAGWMLKPVILMAQVAREVARGDLTRRVEVHTEDEIGELARAFNDMTWSLADSQAELGRRNEELQLIAAEKERLYQNAQVRATRLQVMNEVARSVASSLDPEEIFSQVRLQLSRLMSYEYLTIERWIPEAHRFRRDFVWCDEPPGGAQVGELVDPDLSPLRKVQQTKMPLSIPDFEREPSLRGGRLARAGFHSGFIVPIAARDEFFGVLGMACRRRNGFARVDVATVFAIADTLAVVLKNVDLFQRLQQSYADLKDTQKQLAQSETVRRAEKLRSVGQMASGIAHNFNNVLSAIIGRVQVLKMKSAQGGATGEDLAECLDVIERASLDGSDTVRRLQEFSRGQREAEAERTDLNDLIHTVVEITRPRWKDQAEQNGIHIRIQTRLASVPAAACVPGEIREALTNLVFNAVDAMPRGGTLTLGTRADGDSVIVTVEDTGVGMAPDVRDRVFDPFFTTKGMQGTGLGLSTVYGIVERHKGTIRIDTEPGRGTVFEIRLPVAGAAIRGARHDDLMASRPWSILIGDDEANVREAMADLLRLLGHTVTLASSGEETVRRFQEGDFDLVFTDLGMPDMSGWDVAAAIRGVAPDVPIVLATGWGAEIDDETARSRGVTRVLAKPFTVQKLSSLIAELQSMRRAA